MLQHFFVPPRLSQHALHLKNWNFTKACIRPWSSFQMCTLRYLNLVSYRMTTPSPMDRISRASTNSTTTEKIVKQLQTIIPQYCYDYWEHCETRSKAYVCGRRLRCMCSQKCRSRWWMINSSPKVKSSPRWVRPCTLSHEMNKRGYLLHIVQTTLWEI